MSDTIATRDQHVRDAYEPGVADYLIAGDGFRADSSRPLGRAWDGILAELVGIGLMSRSKTGRYWWLR